MKEEPGMQPHEQSKSFGALCRTCLKPVDMQFICPVQGGTTLGAFQRR